MACICPARGKAREWGTLPGDPALAAIKHPYLPAMTSRTMKQYVSQEDMYPTKEVHPAMETCSRAPEKVGHIESCKKSQIQCSLCPFPGWEVCWESYGQLVSPAAPCSCHLPCKSTALIVPLPLSPISRLCLKAAGNHMLLPWGVVPWFCDCGDSRVCTAALCNQGLGFHVYSF